MKEMVNAFPANNVGPENVVHLVCLLHIFKCTLECFVFNLEANNMELQITRTRHSPKHFGWQKWLSSRLLKK